MLLIGCAVREFVSTNQKPYVSSLKFCTVISQQHAKKVVSDSLGLVDFAIGLVIFVLNLPERQVPFLGEIQITEGLQSILLIKKGFGAN